MVPFCRLFPALLALTGACDSSTGPAPQDLAHLDKIDPPVQALLAGDAPIPVLLLGQTQPLLGPEGLSGFIAENDGVGRSALRASTRAMLQDIAGREQAALLETLREDADFVTPLWLVNGVAAVLTPQRIREMARRDDVRHIYDSDIARAGHVAPGTVSQVVSPDGTPFESDGKTVPWNLDSLRVPAVWNELRVNGEGVVIALLDTGIEYTHPDLRNRMWTNTAETPNNGVDDDGNGYVDDYYGMDMLAGSVEVRPSSSQHGTLVSGILVGDGTGGTVTGVAPGARVMAFRTGSLVSSFLALQYAIEHGADVVNMSFSLPDLGNLRGVWRLAADNATAAGLVLASGAGNFRTSQTVPTQMRVPEDIPSVIASGGVEESHVPTPFSSMGPVGWGDVLYYGDHSFPPGLTKPDVAGFPGPGFALLDPAGGYIDPNTEIRGNSFSGPQAAGIAALVLSAAPELPPWTVKEIIQSTARDLGPPGKDNDTGAGLLDAFAAVQAARGR